MNTLLGWVLGAGLAFLLVIHLADRASVPAWRAKHLYRLIAFVLLLAWVGTAYKAMQWHTELIYMNRLCQ